MATPGSNPTPKYRSDYKPVPYKVEQVGAAAQQTVDQQGSSQGSCCQNANLWTMCTHNSHAPWCSLK